MMEVISSRQAAAVMSSPLRRLCPCVRSRSAGKQQRLVRTNKPVYVDNEAALVRFNVTRFGFESFVQVKPRAVFDLRTRAERDEKKERNTVQLL